VITNFSLQGVSHLDSRETNRDWTLVRIEHGVSPLRAWGQFYRRRTSASVYVLLKDYAWFRHAYERYRTSRSSSSRR